jgi:hypothetical protein
MCQLPTLKDVEVAGLGSDFSQVDECTPDLKVLAIASWDQSAGQQGLTRLNHLENLFIEADLADLRSLPELEGLEHLTVPESLYTPDNRAYLEERYPGCDVGFYDPWTPPEAPADAS